MLQNTGFSLILHQNRMINGVNWKHLALFTVGCKLIKLEQYSSDAYEPVS